MQQIQYLHLQEPHPTTLTKAAVTVHIRVSLWGVGGNQVLTGDLRSSIRSAWIPGSIYEVICVWLYMYMSCKYNVHYRL